MNHRCVVLGHVEPLQDEWLAVDEVAPILPFLSLTFRALASAFHARDGAAPLSLALISPSPDEVPPARLSIFLLPISLPSPAHAASFPPSFPHLLAAGVPDFVGGAHPGVLVLFLIPVAAVRGPDPFGLGLLGSGIDFVIWGVLQAVIVEPEIVRYVAQAVDAYLDLNHGSFCD